MTAQGILGEVLPEGRRLCTASTDVWLNGDSVDAGTAMILDSNLSQQARESLHHLGCALGPGLLVSQTQTSEWQYLLDQASPTNASSFVEQVGWTQARSMCFGPFDLTYDRRTSDGQTPRRVQVVVDCDPSTTSSLLLIAAVTQGPAIPTPTTVLGYSRLVVPVSTRARQTLLVESVSALPTVRRAQQSPSEPTSYVDAYVWLAWKATGDADYISAVDCWEVR
jgi:hypothetical protein